MKPQVVTLRGGVDPASLGDFSDTMFTHIHTYYSPFWYDVAKEIREIKEEKRRRRKCPRACSEAPPVMKLVKGRGVWRWSAYCRLGTPSLHWPQPMDKPLIRSIWPFKVSWASLGRQVWKTFYQWNYEKRSQMSTDLPMERHKFYYSYRNQGIFLKL